jgi:uncharacterized protein with HEPN domain
MEADQLGRPRDILEASRLIASYMKDTSEAQFRADTQKQDAVVRRIEIIGEATAHLSDETRREIAALPFRKMLLRQKSTQCRFRSGAKSHIHAIMTK